MRQVLLLACLAAVGCAGARHAGYEAENWAAQVMKPGEAAERQVTAADRKALTQLHQVNRYEIAVGQLAIERGAPAVKRYAEELVRDHQDNDDRLVSIANDLAVSLGGPDLPDELQSKLEKLRGLQGTAFDQAFQEDMITGHQNAIQDLGAALANVTNADVASLVTDTLPTLRQHLDDARALDLRGT